jgi:hypothetical protein
MWAKVKNWFKRLGMFSAGMFVGTIYGSVVSTIITYGMLRLMWL